MESNVTIVSFDAKVTTKVVAAEGGNKIEKVLKRFTQCYVKKTDQEIHEQLHGWDHEYKLGVLIRVGEPVEYNWQPKSKEIYKITVVIFNVMDQKQTEVFFDKSNEEILNELEARQFQSYVVTSCLKSQSFRFDALNSITNHKDTN